MTTGKTRIERDPSTTENEGELGHRSPNIFLLEGSWVGPLEDESVTSILNFLEATTGTKGVRREATTEVQLKLHLNCWTRREGRRFPILYLGYHGAPGKLYLTHHKETAVNLDWLETVLAGKCGGKMIHVGACQTLRVHQRRLAQFLERTGAIGITGFGRLIDWEPAMIFDALLLSHLVGVEMNRSGINRAICRVRKSAQGLCEQLDFRSAIRVSR